MNVSRVQHSSRIRNRAWLMITAVISTGALMLSSCTSAPGQPTAAETGQATSTTSAALDERDRSEDAAGDGSTADARDGSRPVQDIWIWEHVFTVGEDGELMDLTERMVSGLTWDSDDTVELMDGVHFTPVPELAPRMLHTATEVRADLDVVAGVVEYDGRRAIQIIATPTGATSVAFNDRLVMDLGYLGLDVGAPLIVDYAFAQGIPAVDVDDGVTSTEILTARLADDRFWWYSIDEPDAEGGIDPGLLTAVGSVPDLASITGDIVPARFGRSPESTPTVGVALYDRSSAAGAVTADTSASAGSAGGTPAKQVPKPLPYPNPRKCLTSAYECLSAYFKAQRANSKAINDFIKRNLDSESDNKDKDTAVCFPNVKGSKCATSSGDPHLKTFDGVRMDLQQVGEFVAAKTDGLEVQIRTSPWRDSETISINTAVAIGFGDHRVTVQRDRDAMVLLDGEPLDIGSYVSMEFGEYTLTFWADVLAVRGPDGIAAGASGISPGGLALDVSVASGEPGRQWQGLFGDADGERVNDLQGRDGIVLAQPATQADYYSVVSNSWRITDAESLFDYEAGESTATFTDLSFPSTIVTLDDIDPNLRQMATVVCIEAGVTDPGVLRECIFDYAMTRDISFVRGAQYQTGVAVSHLDDGWITGVSGISRVAGPAVFAGSDLVLVPTYGHDTHHWIVALDRATGDEQWRFDTGGQTCVAGTDSGHVVVPYRFEGADSDRRLAQLDPADGSILAEIELGDSFAGSCRSMVSVGETVIMNSDKMRQGHTDVLGYDAAAAAPVFTTSVAASSITNLAVSDDGTVWMGANQDGKATGYQFELATGGATAYDIADITFNHRLVGTETGFAVSFTNDADRDTGGMLWFDAASEPRKTELPTEDFADIPTGRLAAGDGYLASYLHSEVLAVLDARTGQPHRLIRPSSFNNNDGQVGIHDGLAIVGNFGSDRWLEAIDLASGLHVWSLNYELMDDEDANIGDIKYIGPVTEDGLVVISAGMEDGILVGMVGPNSLRN